MPARWLYALLRGVRCKVRGVLPCVRVCIVSVSVSVLCLFGGLGSKRQAHYYSQEEELPPPNNNSETSGSKMASRWLYALLRGVRGGASALPCLLLRGGISAASAASARLLL